MYAYAYGIIVQQHCGIQKLCISFRINTVGITVLSVVEIHTTRSMAYRLTVFPPRRTSCYIEGGRGQWCVAICGARIGNANPGGIFQTRVYGFDGLQTRVPGFMIMSVRRVAGTYCRPTVVVTCQR